MIRHRYEAWNRHHKLGRYAPQPKQKTPTSYYGPPTPPGQSTIDALFPDFHDRSETEWDALLNARVKPFIDTVEKSTIAAKGMSEFQFERAAAANEGLGKAFLSILTGGKTGAEAEQFSKDNFGGQYLGAQAMSIAADKLSQLTSKWEERDWEISSQYLEAMEKVPGLREQLRQDIQSADENEYDRQFKYATLLLDEAWNVYNADAKAYDSAEQRKIAAAAIKREQDEARRERNAEGYKNRRDAVSEAGRFSDDTNTIWEVVKNKDGTFSARNTGKAKPTKPGTKAKPPAITGPPNHPFISVNGKKVKNPNWHGTWKGAKPIPPPAAAGSGSDGPQPDETHGEVEAGLAKDVQTSYRELIQGKMGNTGQIDNDGNPIQGRVGGMDYDDAVAWLRNLAKSQFPWRGGDWINDWVYRQLLPYFPETARPRQGN